MIIHTIKTAWSPNELKQNTYIIEGEKSCVIVDAGCSIKSINEVSSKFIEAIFITHGHFDHIEFIEEFDKLNVPIYVNKATIEYLENPKLNLTSEIGTKHKSYKVKNLQIVDDGDLIKTNSGDVICAYSPGHSADSTCYIIGENLFSGDSLFSIAVGRYDLPGSNISETIKTLRKINCLSYVNLYPGHGRTSTKQEQNNNIAKWIKELENRL